MPTLIMVKGLPASGKTTWSRKQRGKRVNKDDLRAMIDDKQWSKANEKLILDARDKLIRLYLGEGHDVIVDDTNLAPKHEDALSEIAQEFDAELVVKDFTDVPLDECIRRDQNRPNYVGEKVIKSMYNTFLRPKEEATPSLRYTPPEHAREAIICDIDGTLAHMTNRSPFEWHRVGEDTVDPVVGEIIRNTKRSTPLDEKPDPHIIMLSGRDSICRADTIKWLVDNNIPFDDLWMRAAGDNRKDAVVKRELFDEFIRDRYNVLYILDDRNQVVEMWRGMGLKVLQVADGNF